MTTNENLDCIRDALRSEQANTHSGQAVACLKQPFLLGDGEKWHYEGFVSMFCAIRHALASLDDSISPDLPPFLLDPATIARVFRIPLEDFNWRGSSHALAARLAQIEAKLDHLQPANADEGSLAPTLPQCGSSAELPDCLPSRMAAALLGVDKKTLEKLRIGGFLKWRVKNPTSSRREYLYERQSVLVLQNSYRIGDTAKTHHHRPRRKVSSGYVPQHITLE
jgi:hypothetical protein